MTADTGYAVQGVRRPSRVGMLFVVAALLGASGCTDAGSDPPAPEEDRLQSQIRAFEETGGRGVWAKARERPADRRRLAERLFALGYLDGVREATDAADGVVAYDPTRAWNGLNLYVAGHGEEALLIDMRGQVVHRWTFDLAAMGAGRPRSKPAGELSFRRAWLLPEGDLLVLYDSRALLRLDKDSRLRWAYEKEPHHEFEVQPNGDVVVLTAERRSYAALHPTRKFWDNSVVRLDSEGHELSRVSILDALSRSTIRGLWAQLQDVVPTKMGKLGDVLHTNSVQVLDETLAKRVPLFRPGHVLVSLPIIHAVLAIDPGAQRVVWALQGDFRFQHHAKMLPTGRLLLFDNQRGDDDQSAVLEIDPLIPQTVWSYRGTPERPFFSWCCGTCYRLPNGNTLMVETEGGRALEVTAAGETVWEFLNPHRAGKNHDLIAQMFDLIRIDADQHAAWLSPSAAP